MTRQFLIDKIGSVPPEKRLVIDDQDAFDIMKQIAIKHKKCVADYDKIAKYFYSPYVAVSCRRLFDFCKQNIQYREESIDKQFTSSPQTILKRGYGDCKSYALFIGGVLDALRRDGMPVDWCYRFASEDFVNPHSQPGHVFVVVTFSDGEIWIDPVLQTFNQDHEFASWQDRYVKTPVSVGRCGCYSIGATTAQTGQAIMKISAALAPVPVVGWIAGAAGAVVGGLIAILGSKWNQSPDVRWLIQLYQKYVLGQANVGTDNQVNESYTQQAQAFFSVVTGVPIGGRKDLNILQNGNGDTNTPSLQPVSVRASNYLAFKNLQGQVSQQQAEEAAQIVASWNWFNNPQPGAWSGFLAAPSVIDNSGVSNKSDVYVNQAGQLTDASGVPVSSGNNHIFLIAVIAVAAFLLIK